VGDASDDATHSVRLRRGAGRSGSDQKGWRQQHRKQGYTLLPEIRTPLSGMSSRSPHVGTQPEAQGKGSLASRARRGVTARAVIAGLVLTPLNVIFIMHATMLLGGFRFTGRHSLFVNTIATLFVLALINQWLKRRRPRWAFGEGEMLTIYLMMGMSTGLISSAFDLGGSLAGTITYPFWFATKENRWRELLWPNLPAWLTVQDRTALESFYVGGVNPYRWSAFQPWLTPALWYAAFMGAVMWVCLCMNSIVRRRWEEEERLPFPLTVLPLQLVDESGSLFRNKLWWMGVGIAVALGLWNSFAGLVPALPTVPLGIDYGSYIQNRPPWSSIRFSQFEWQPFAIGLCYLVPLDLALSLLVFDVFWQAEYVLAAQLGWSTSKWSGFPYGDQQSTGGFAALLLSALWLDRHYTAQVVRRVLGLKSHLQDESQEAFSYRGAALGMIAGLAFLFYFLQHGGVQVWVALAFLAIYFPMALVISRLRAQLGPPTHQLAEAMPNWVLPALAGTQTLGARTLGMFAMLTPFLMEQRNNPSPMQLEAFRMASGGRMERRRIALALALVPPIAIIFYFWASVVVCYKVGLSSTIGYYPYLHVPYGTMATFDESVRYPSGADTSVSLAMGVGLVMTLALMFLKLRFQWWPLHPVALPIAIASTIQALTLVIFVTWLVKALLLRYGGLRAHRTALPFFLGLLAGGAVEAMLRRCLSLLLGVNLSFLAT